MKYGRPPRQQHLTAFGAETGSGMGAKKAGDGQQLSMGTTEDNCAFASPNFGFFNEQDAKMAVAFGL